ncbi:survival motor neuron interacting protein 1-domain-containing protein [Hyaloraphidium curvatum]|nr:survival motor neuron interacting protein 1-domain-containing protein [Hyaloraphidium curvatum]
MARGEDDYPVTAQRAVLPVAERPPEDGNPTDGSEYLALVRAETRALPDTVVVPVARLAAKSAPAPSHPLVQHFDVAAAVLHADFDVACTTRPDLIPRESWRNSYLSRFNGMRGAVAGFRARRRDAIAMGMTMADVPERLPAMSDQQNWRRLLYPEHREDTNGHHGEEDGEAEEADQTRGQQPLDRNPEEIDVEDRHGDGPADNGEPENGEVPPPRESVSQNGVSLGLSAPTTEKQHLTLPARLNPTEIEQLLRMHLQWMKHPLFVELDLLSSQVRWVSSLLLHLDPDLLTGDLVSVLRELSRSCRMLRKRIGGMTLGPEPEDGAEPERVPGSHPAVAGLNMVVVAIAGAFGQVDLSDPGRSHIATVSEAMRDYLAAERPEAGKEGANDGGLEEAIAGQEPDANDGGAILEDEPSHVDVGFAGAEEHDEEQGNGFHGHPGEDPWASDHPHNKKRKKQKHVRHWDEPEARPAYGDAGDDISYD